MSKERQHGFTDIERSMVKRETKRERFLSVMEMASKTERWAVVLIRWGCCCRFTFCSNATLSVGH